MTQLSDFSGVLYWNSTPADLPIGYLSFGDGYLTTTHPTSLSVTDQRVVLAILNPRSRQVLQCRLLLRSTHDAELIDRAYEQWGDGLSDALTGAFVVLIWERQAKTLRVIRDRFGFIPLYYQYVPGVSFRFANRIAALPHFQKAQHAVDRQKIRQYLTLPTSYRSPEDRTFYQDVKAALPGHTLRVGPDGLTTTPYWTPKPEQYQSLSRDEDYIGLFREYFIESVSTCVAGHARVGTHLSGGLDSSSVACVARTSTDPLSTFYVNPSLPSTDETFFVEAVVRKIHAQHHEVAPLPNIYEAMYRISSVFDRPEHFTTPSSFHLAAAEKIREADCDVVLTGHDGDSVVDNGNSLIQTHRRAHDWPRLKWAIEAYASHRDLSYLREGWLGFSTAQKQHYYTEYYLGNELWQLLKKKQLRPLLHMAQAVHREMGYSYASFLSFVGERLWDRLQAQSVDSLLTEDLQKLQATDVLDGEALYNSLRTEFLEQFRAITNRAYVDATEQMYHIGRHYGHTYAHPFFDEKLVELSLAIPEKLKFGNGAGRDTIRRALQGTLPEEVRTRGFKTSFSEL